jgi:hypothetical protein
VTADRAFRLLADASMHNNRKVRDLAEEPVFTGEFPDAPPGPPTSRAPPRLTTG